MKKSLLVLSLLVAACSPQSSSPVLKTGIWTGGLTPMNHPDMTMPLTYRVAEVEGQPSIVLVLGEEETPTRDVQVQGDTLSFVFNEPEGNVLLTCALGRQPDAGYAGRCTDAEGKWGHFTMIPPQ